jgi:hypothetical protein
MTDIRSLERTLLDNLAWNKARIKAAGEQPERLRDGGGAFLE